MKVPLKTNLSYFVPWASSRPSRGSLLLLWAQSPFSLSPETSTLLWPGGLPALWQRPRRSLDRERLSLMFVVSHPGSFLLLFPSSIDSAPPSDSSRLHPRSAHPVSAQGSLTSSVIRGSGHITRRSPKSGGAELRNHLSSLDTRVCPSSSSCPHPCASRTLWWASLPVSE